LKSNQERPIYFEWVEIPAGEFLMGNNPLPNYVSNADENPEHSLYLDAFEISKTPITNEQYAEFVLATGYKTPSNWRDGEPEKAFLNHPVTYVDWKDAQAFATWCGAKLPTEAQWEKSSRGASGKIFPWGDEISSLEIANFGNKMGTTSPVGAFTGDKSEYGVMDLAGNVWEWCSSLYQNYPYQSSDGREDLTKWGARVVRGGNYLSDVGKIRNSHRHPLHVTAKDMYIGFRLVKEVNAPLNPDISITFDWIEIPAGQFLMGSDFSPLNETQKTLTKFGSSKHQSNRPADFDNECPQHKIYLDNFRISKSPITNQQYEVFTKMTGHTVPSHWPEGRVTPEIANHPVVYVDGADVDAFCSWAGVRLPTESEWERAARGRDGQIWPWGNSLPNDDCANFGKHPKLGGTTPVGAFPAGATSEGLLDMAGNVWEMTSSAYRGYPYDSHDGREEINLNEEYVLRGGSFYSPHGGYLRASARSMSHRGRRRDHIGFRVVDIMLLIGD
jgi:formylglycine-generating enzyme required for sulfatase activity